MCGTVPTPITRPRATTSLEPRARAQGDLEDIKYVLSSHYQGTEYDCYGSKGTPATRGPIVPSASTATVSSPCCSCAYAQPALSRRAVDGVWLQLV
ncbi:MAG: C69 family dipeptidase [Collinsella sp.]